MDDLGVSLLSHQMDVKFISESIGRSTMTIMTRVSAHALKTVQNMFFTLMSNVMEEKHEKTN